MNKSIKISIASTPDELKICTRYLPVSKKPVYIYTEEDLGEGILDVGVTS